MRRRIPRPSFTHRRPSPGRRSSHPGGPFPVRRGIAECRGETGKQEPAITGETLDVLAPHAELSNEAFDSLLWQLAKLPRPGARRAQIPEAEIPYEGTRPRDASAFRRRRLRVSRRGRQSPSEVIRRERRRRARPSPVGRAEHFAPSRQRETRQHCPLRLSWALPTESGTRRPASHDLLRFSANVTASIPLFR